MYLEENIRRLNIHYLNIPISFIEEDSRIVVIEEIAYYLSQNPELKEILKWKYKMRFGADKKWSIGKEGIMILSSRIIKLSPSYLFQDLKNKLDFYINMIDDVPLREGVKNVFEYLPESFTMPGSMRKHHSYKYGLIEHLIQTVEFSLKIAEISDVQEYVNIDILIAGALLHDIGKCHSYEVTDIAYLPSNTMVMQDHIIHGITLVEKYLKPLSNHINPLFKDAIFHIIASHHGVKEYGSPIEPKSLEAMIICSQDGLSARIGG